MEFKSFVEQLPVYIGLVQNVSLSANVDDTVLALAASHHGASRAGSPDPDELTEEQTEWLIAASREPQFDLIKVDPEVIPELGGGAHDFWYANPWVSTDVLVQLIYHARPADRGLETFETRHGEDIWGFPQDYPERVVEAVRRLENP